MKFGDVVYHVANPDVAGVVVENPCGPRWVKIMFESKVSFSGNLYRGYSQFWECSMNLLFKSPELAKENDDPNWRSK